MIGEKSGCLEVIGGYKTIENEIKAIEKKDAEEEWNKFDRWWTWKDISFEKYYKLNKEEIIAYQNKYEMPQSYIDKYLKQEIPSIYNKPFLFHKSKPNTSGSLKIAYKNKELIQVRCNKCNREWITDYTTFSCTKWRSCSGAECYKCTISNDQKDHNTCLYDMNSSKYELKEIKSELLTVSELGNQLSYYSIPANEFENQLVLAYVSDIHILHHVKNLSLEGIKKTTDRIAKELCASLTGQDFIIFNGDIASDPKVVIDFFERFLFYFDKNKKAWRTYKHNIYVVLGNHEYIGFPSISAAVDFYRQNLEELGITLLHNESYSVGNTNKILIFGGTGFAKYNEIYNADTLDVCDNFTREDEIKETEAFEQEYYKALTYAKENKMCFISVSHYPLESCLNNKYDNTAIYFTGHDHHNRYIKNEDMVLYADNQIGLNQKHFCFKVAKTGFYTNPYYLMKDGLYITSIEDYLQFYRYIGESIGDGSAIYQRCEGGKANLYVIKHNGYYGFFILNPQGVSKGVSIVNGGVTKKISKSTDIKWICDNFDIVLIKYLKALLPLRILQEKISKELKELGFSGNIHGTIVDIDFYHHIMVNPIEGSIKLYYSPTLGCVKYFNDFSQVLDSIDNNKTTDIDVKKIKKQIVAKERKGQYSLSVITTDTTLQIVENEDINDDSFHLVSLSEGSYGVSRKVNPLQRLFSGRVLRDFDINLVEIEQKPFRKKLYTGKIVIYNKEKYIISEDNGSDFVTLQKHSWFNNFNGESIAEQTRISIRDLKKCFEYRGGWVDIVLNEPNKITILDIKEALKYNDKDNHIPNFPYLKRGNYRDYFYNEEIAEDSLIKDFLYMIPYKYWENETNALNIMYGYGISASLFPSDIWSDNLILMILDKSKIKDVIERILPVIPDSFKTDNLYREIRARMPHKNRPKWCPKEIWNINI